MSVKKHPTTISTVHLLDVRRQRNNRKQVSLLSQSKRIVLFTITSALVMLAGILLAGGIYLNSISKELPSVENLARWVEPESGETLPPTTFYDRSGEILLYTLENPGVERRYFSVDPSDELHFSPQLVQLVTTLEGNFWSGPGISLKKIGDAEPYTIAEKLVDEFLMENSSEGFDRAIRLRILALQLQIRFGKAQLLEWYLNTAYFGHLAYGADQAAQVYLGKSAAELNLAESAQLVSLLSTPTLNPLDAPEAAREQTLSVLEQLAASGKYSSADIEHAKSFELTFRSPDETEGITEFIRFSIDQSEDFIDYRRLERGGWKVITTLDAGLQQQAICTLETQLLQMSSTSQTNESTSANHCQAAEQLPTFSSDVSPFENDFSAVNGNILVMNPISSQILAWSGAISSKGKQTSPEYDAGSLLSPFIATTAFTHGMSPATLVWDVPETNEKINLNPDGKWHGPLSLRQAVHENNFNALYKTAQLIGFDNVWSLANTLGLHHLDSMTFQEDLVYGKGTVTMPEIGQAFSTFATLGQQSGIPNPFDDTLSPVSVLRVEDIYGNVIYNQETVITRPVLDPGLAYLVHDMLSNQIVSTNQQFGLNMDQPAAVAMGTAVDGSQVWTAGYTPEYLSVVWMGMTEKGTTENKQGLSTIYPADVWEAVLRYAARNEIRQDWQIPSNIVKVTVCNPSGQLPTSACPELVDELFLSGNEPAAYDTLYQTYSVNRETGNLATIFTSLELVDQKTYFVVPSEYVSWALAENISQPPDRYDPIESQETIEGMEITSPASLAYIHGMVEITGNANGDDFVSWRLDVGQGMYPHSWIQIGEESDQPVRDAVLGSWDTHGYDGLYVIRLSVQRTQYKLDTIYTQVVVDNTTPEAAITWPRQNQEIAYQNGETVVFLAEASDSVGMEHVTWYLDGTAIADRNVEPWFLAWPLVEGNHVLKVAAYDLAGNRTESPEVKFSVK